jgi:hypothetical protein
MRFNVSDTNSKNKPAEQLTRLKTHIRNDGDDDDLSFMGSPPLLPLDDADEYYKLREDVGKSAPADFFGQFFGRMFTDTAWEARRYQTVTTNYLDAQLKQYLDPTVDDQTKLALVVADTIDPLERLHRLRSGREHRLDALYRLVQEHRANLGTLLRPTAEQVQDAEFREISDETGEADQSRPQTRQENKP